MINWLLPLYSTVFDKNPVLQVPLFVIVFNRITLALVISRDAPGEMITLLKSVIPFIDALAFVKVTVLVPALNVP